MNGPGPAQDCGAVDLASTRPLWWLVDDADRVVGGPFDSRAEAAFAVPVGVLALDPGDGVAHPVPAFGVRRDSGSLARRPSPEDRAWLADLSDQLERVGEEWDPLVDDGSPLVGLLCEVAAALVEVGLPLHDCTGRTPARSRGGVCLTPGTTADGADGVIVAWTPHERAGSEVVRGGDLERWLLATLNRTLADLLAGLGFAVVPFGAASAHLVTAGRAATQD
ncbi:hypothetical protein [Blastococcus sp. SYSU D00820]